MKMEDISRAAIEFGNEAGERLQTLLGRVPDPQEFMAFYGTASGTICGNALSEIVKAAGKEIGAQWLMETLGLIQLTARRNGADIVIAGGLSLKTVSSPMGKQQAAPAPPPPILESNVCQCQILDGTCRSCERELDRTVERFTNLIKNTVDASHEAGHSKICKVCKIRLVDGVLARSIRKNAPSFGDRLPAAIEIFTAVVLQQLKGLMPEVSFDETLKAVNDAVAMIKK